MGGTLSQATKSRDDNTSLDSDQLTEHEKQIIHNTWPKLEPQADQIGMDIYFKIFEMIPVSKQFFPFRDAVGEELLNDPYFKGHTKRFFNAIRMAVFNLEALDVSSQFSFLQNVQYILIISVFGHVLMNSVKM